MNDIDFEELDRAINSVLSEQEKSAAPKSKPVSKKSSDDSVSKDSKVPEKVNADSESKFDANVEDNLPKYDEPKADVSKADMPKADVPEKNSPKAEPDLPEPKIDNLIAPIPADKPRTIDMTATDPVSKLDDTLPQTDKSHSGAATNNLNAATDSTANSSDMDSPLASVGDSPVPPLVLPQRSNFTRSAGSSSLHSRTMIGRPVVQARGVGSSVVNPNPVNPVISNHDVNLPDVEDSQPQEVNPEPAVSSEYVSTPSSSGDEVQATHYSPSGVSAGVDDSVNDESTHTEDSQAPKPELSVYEEAMDAKIDRFTEEVKSGDVIEHNQNPPKPLDMANKETLESSDITEDDADSFMKAFDSSKNTDDENSLAKAGQSIDNQQDIVSDMAAKMTAQLGSIASQQMYGEVSSSSKDGSGLSAPDEGQSLDGAVDNEGSDAADRAAAEKPQQRKRTAPRRRAGRFMDIVHPALDMTHPTTGAVAAGMGAAANTSVDAPVLENNIIGSHHTDGDVEDNIDSPDPSVQIDDNTMSDNPVFNEDTEAEASQTDAELTTDIVDEIYSGDDVVDQDYPEDIEPDTTVSIPDEDLAEVDLSLGTEEPRRASVDIVDTDNTNSSQMEDIQPADDIDTNISPASDTTPTSDVDTIATPSSVVESVVAGDTEESRPIFDAESYNKPMVATDNHKKLNLWTILIGLLGVLVVVAVVLLWSIIRG